jgi:valyl-tRNA synthetase
MCLFVCRRDTWFRWLDNIQDWCVSRQLWWGHRIPAWKATISGEEGAPERWFVARSEEAALTKAVEETGRPVRSWTHLTFACNRAPLKLVGPGRGCVCICVGRLRPFR